MPIDGSSKNNIKAGRKALTNIFQVSLYIKKARGLYESCRRDFSNGYINRSREQSQNILEAYC